MLRLRNTALAVCLPLLLIGARAEAEIIHLVATLTHAAENPPTNGMPLLTCPNPGPTCGTGGVDPRPLSFGGADFYLDTTLHIMTMVATIYNIDVTTNQAAPVNAGAGTGTQTPNDRGDDLTAAHIHASPTASLSTTAPVVWGFFAAPQNDTTPDDRTLTPFANGPGGIFTAKWDTLEGNGTTLLLQENNILTGHAYINFHTNQFTGGEIRGFLLIPEPATLALMGLGLASLARVRRRSA